MSAETLVPVAVHCGKCGTDMTITPVDAAAKLMLYDLATDLAEWREGIDCPMCKLTRGGSYPLLRVPSDDEAEAIAEYRAAFAADAASVVPEDYPVDATDEQAEAVDAAFAVYDAIGERLETARARLLALGYPRQMMYELEIAS